jgi:hypothetical protein
MIASLLALRSHGPPPPGQTELTAALTPWERRLLLESLGRWLLRGAAAGLITIMLVVLYGWLTPTPEADLHPLAFELALVPLLISVAIACWPRRHVHHAAQIDARLGLDDRLTTAWAFRDSDVAIARLQRADALDRLRPRIPKHELASRPARLEVIAVGAVVALTLLLLITPSPQQSVLDERSAEQLAVQQASQQLDALRESTAASAELTPDQVRQLDELLQQAQSELNRTQNQQAASAVLARTQDQISQQLGDPNADLRDEALAAMSETLAAEPQTQALGDALQHEDANAASRAISDMAARSDQLSDVERQALSRALQRAANVGRSDPNTASALRNASQAVANGASAKSALSQADAALRQSIEASQSQAALEATLQQLRELQTRVASGQPMTTPSDRSLAQQMSASGTPTGLASGTPVALDAAGSRQVTDPTSGQNGKSGGVGPGSDNNAGQAPPQGQAAENVFVPGRIGNGASQQDLVDQPFTIRGAPRPYRDVLNQYAQSSRDYVDRPDISPAVRDLVKQYFQELEQSD